MDKVKQMIYDFRKDGSMRCVYDADIIDEPFIGIIHNTINVSGNIWFKVVEDAKKTKKKIKPFRIIVRI